MKAECLDEDAVLAFLAGRLDSEGRARVVAHVASCAACSDVVIWAAADLAGGDRPPGREGVAFIGQLEPGTRVDRYRILEPVGRGAMGEVYAAYHPDLDRRIALKIVLDPLGLAAALESPDHLRAGRERRARLLREARAIARLSHPNVVTVHDAGTVGEQVYVVMEFVDGQTLDVWLHAEPRRWGEILDVFLAAGRGLAAAHAAGIVHRDFKPQNVMIGKDGVVRVMDFGLARMVGDEPVASEHSDANARPADVPPAEMPAGNWTTRTGAFLGTPAYMAPEQFRGLPADARSDQFAFCVALHEALYGQRPALASLVSSAPEAAPPAAAADSAVPAWLRRIVRRGLSVERDARFPSLDDLLAAIERDRTRPRRRRLTITAAVGLTVLSFAGWRAAQPRRFDCRPPADRVAAAWPVDAPADSRRQSVHRAFLASGRPDAEQAWTRFAAAIDDYVRRWTITYTGACEATHVRGEQSAELLDLRMRCLYDNLDDVRALTEVLANSHDGRGISPTVVGQLTPLSRCADAAVLHSLVPLPRDEKTLAEVRALRQSTKEVRIMAQAGLEQEALAKVYAIRAAAERINYKPLLAEVLDVAADVETNVGDPKKAEALYLDALAIAEASGHDEAAAMAASGLAFIVGYAQGRHAEGRAWARLGHAILDRLGPGHSGILAWVAQAEAGIAIEEHQFEKARALLEEALRLRIEALGPEHPDVARALSNLGWILNEMGLAQQAVAMHDRAKALVAKYGNTAPILLNNRADALHQLKRNSEAEADWRRSVELPQNDRDLAAALTGLGQLALERGDADAAMPLLDRALRLREANEPDPILVAETRFALADALWNNGKDRPRALLLARQAGRACGDQGCPWRLAGLDAWLKARDRRGLQPPLALH